jgi:hypothetical protein
VKRLRLHISNDAAREIADALVWWRANRIAAPEALKEDLRHGLELIRTQPGVGALARNVRLSGVRRINLSRVRYFVYYIHFGRRLDSRDTPILALEPRYGSGYLMPARVVRQVRYPLPR